MATTHRLGILLSGRGSNFIAIAENVTAGKIPAEIAVVISNRPGSPGLEEAERRGLHTRMIPSKGLEREQFERQLVPVLQEKQVDLICCAGFIGTRYCGRLAGGSQSRCQ